MKVVREELDTITFKEAIVIIVEEAAKLGKTVCRSYAEHILFEHTGWPWFWNIPVDGHTPEECLRKHASEYFNDVYQVMNS